MQNVSERLVSKTGILYRAVRDVIGVRHSGHDVSRLEHILHEVCAHENATSRSLTKQTGHSVSTAVMDPTSGVPGRKNCICLFYDFFFVSLKYKLQR